MTNAELVTRFIRYYGGEITEERVGNDITPVAPYILMDIAYQSFCKHISPLKLTGLAKVCWRRWAKSYRDFNKQIFLPFKIEEYDAVTDRMDEIGEYLADEIKGVEDAVMAYLDGILGPNAKEVFTCVLLNNILAQSANELICIASEGLTGTPAKSRELDGVRIWCIKFANAYLPPSGDIDTSNDPGVCDAVSALSKKIAKWIFKQ